ncbi:MAG: hypothetical protein ACRCYY_16025, partial [Trueperaceae bacterium]
MINTYRITVTPTVATRQPHAKLYFLRGELSKSQVAELTKTLLADPVSETYEVTSLQRSYNHPYIDVGFLPGVTDSVAENLVNTAKRLGFAASEAATGAHYILGDKQPLVSEFANPVIHRYSINTPITPAFLEISHNWQPLVETMDLRTLSNDELLEVSRERRLSMDLAEMQALQSYYRKENRTASDLELEMFAQTWSEHCVHKTFKAEITT